MFLDEIGNLPLHLQPKLLTALEQRQVVPVGANKPVPIDVRVVAATNLPAEKLADEGRFRQDLLFRLNTIEIQLPPLRARREDIPLLLEHYLALYGRKYDRPARTLGGETLSVLANYDWPGNVRALRHAAERAVILADGDAYRLEDFPLPSRPDSSPLPTLGGTLNLDQLEKQMIERALQDAPFQHLAGRRRARPQPRGALPAHGKAWPLRAARVPAPVRVRAGLAHAAS